jgi:aminoglycoside phosphotransferase
MLAFVPERSALILHAAQGLVLSDILESGALRDAVRGSRAAARWLAALHQSPLRVGPPEHDCVSLKAFRVAATLIEVSAQFPGRSRSLLEVLYQLQERIARYVPAPSVVQTHGSYCPRHVFVAGNITTVIDLDRSLPADPARDVAEFVADIWSAACDGQYDRQVAEPAAEAFLSEYFSQAADPETLKTRVACFSSYYLTLRLLKRIKDAGADPGWSERLKLYREAIIGLADRL